ncbi:iron transporter [Xanthobacteraceae bacterium Astr-EGSB]|uniref:iron transporter n=1 Tax=Astrobacterium formosum TaxID=3069710 RepID=UPI0027B28175|nr:iron transporter [Xanthobacteraceae bacterium Astr-EGSB]
MAKTPHTIGRSDEADARGLELGRREGEALGRTLRHMIDEVADTGDEIASGDYLIGFAAEKAEGMYLPRDGRLEWREPEDENVHLEVAVRDHADGRLIPGLDVRVTVTDEDGQEIGTHEHPLLWHPYLYHYGRNWHIPRAGRYSLRVRFEAPRFARHDRKNGCRLSEGADVTFDNVMLQTGKE